MIRVPVTSFRELTAMVRGLKFIEKEWLTVFTREARGEVEPMWREELNASRPNRLQRAVLVETSRVAVSRRAIQLKVGSVGKLSSGDKPGRIARAVEFGQDQSLRSTYVRRDKPVPAPSSHVVNKRRSARPVGPRVPKGNVVWPALGRFAPRAAAVVAQKFYDVMKRIPGVD